MTADDFRNLYEHHGYSRAEFCKMLGIAPNTGTAYALGRKAIPRYIALACAALDEGLEPYCGIPSEIREIR